MKNLVACLKNKWPLRKIPVIIFSIIAASFIYLLWVTWLKWGHLFVDTPRELWIPEQILKGKILYRDMPYQYGFLPYYFLALLYKLFGVHLRSLVYCGIGVTVFMSLAMYRISRLFLDHIVSGLVALTFLFVFAFGGYNYDGTMNFILPYSFASTFYMLFLSWALYFFIRFIFTQARRTLFVWGLFMSLAFFCRPELTLSAYIVFSCAGLVYIWQVARKDALRLLLVLLLPLAIGFLGYGGFLSAYHACAGFKESLGYIKVGLSSPAAKFKAGFDDIPFFSLIMFASLLLHLLAVALFEVSAVLLRSPRRIFKLLGAALAAGVLVPTCWYGYRYFLIVTLQYRCVPLILIIGICIFAWRIFRRVNFQENLAYLCVFIIALLQAVRVFFKAGPYDYGFFVLCPGLICYYFFFFMLGKARMRGCPEGTRAFFFPLLFVFFLSLIPAFWFVSYWNYHGRSIKITTAKGTMLCWNDYRTFYFWMTVARLRQDIPKDATVAVLPEGVSLNFFCEKENPVRYYTFLPVDIELFGEDRIITDLAAAKADYIVIIGRDSVEFGYPFFGVQYGEKIATWVYDHYVVFKQYGPLPFTSLKFGIVILKKGA